ncbi:MAG: outer membrane lipoprotein carrier protein LolA [Longimicrobiales bacterium]
MTERSLCRSLGVSAAVLFLAAGCSDASNDTALRPDSSAASPAPASGDTQSLNAASFEPATDDTAPAASAAKPGIAPGSTAGALPPERPLAPVDDEGARILKRTAATYANVRTMTADFTMVTENPLLRTKTPGRGKMYQHRPDRFALRFSEPANELLLSDGEFFWVYLPGTYKDQVFKSSANAAGSSGVDLQAQFVGDPVERFRYTMQGQGTIAGSAVDVLLLVPRARAEYKSLKVWIDRKDALIRRFEIVEPSGVIRHIDLSGLRTNVTIPASMFRFAVPAGVRVVEQ